MMNLVYIAVLIYVTFYTVNYAVIIWKQGNKFGGLVVFILGLSVIIIPLIIKYLDFVKKILDKIM